MEKVMIASVLCLSACVPLGNDTVAPVPDEGVCPAPELGHLISQPVEGYDFDAIQTPVRVLPPGAMMTMDHNPERLNVDLDDAGRIVRLWCG